MKVIGITGSFKTGKSTVTKMFSEFGAEIIDADKLVHQALESNTEIYKRVIEEFGRGILNKEGKIKREKLAEIVFEDSQKLNILEKIIHPYVIDEIKRRILYIKRTRPESVIFIEVPLLYEVGIQNIMDEVIVVSASRDKQMERAKKSTQLSEKEIKKRIASQFSLNKKEELANVVVDNNGSLGKTKEQVDKIWRKIKE